MSLLPRIFKRIVNKKTDQNPGELYIEKLKQKGIRIGEGTVIFSPPTTIIDQTSPHMIVIGKNVQISQGVTILSHDYGWSVLKAKYGVVLGSIRPVNIGDNVYIGMNATILAGVTIGNNVIIGANSLVSKNIPDECVAAGNPCKPISSLENYFTKRREKQLEEAITFVKYYHDCYGVWPKQEDLYEHFWLFTKNQKELPARFVSQNNLMVGSEEITWKNFNNHTPLFNSFREFLEYAISKIDDR